VVAGEGAINPFAKRSGGLARANGKSHADNVVLPPQCGGGGEWDNGSINIRANMVITWANLWSISAQEVWGREFSLMMASEHGAVDRYNHIAGADSVGGTAVGQYSPPMVDEVGGEYVVLPGWCSNGETLPIDAACVDGPDGRAVRPDAYAGWDGNAIEGWEGGHRGDRREPSSRGKLLKCLIFVLFLS
jgi:hypothetical protein